MAVSTQTSVTLHDGRRLGYLACGAENGLPVFYCHGFPGSRLEVLLADRAAADHSIRLIGVDRPGYGLSDPKPGRRLAGWADDLAELADSLNIFRFSVLGVSGGVPYAAACAFKLPSRLLSLGLACGLSPIDAATLMDGMTAINRFGLRLSAGAPQLLWPAFAPVAVLLKFCPALAVAFIASRAEQPDRAFLRRRDVRTLLSLTFREAMRGGLSGAVSDLRIYGAAWGFRLEDIRVPACLWHGEMDRIVPVAMGRRLAAAIPVCRAVFLPDHGHFSLILEGMNSIMGEIAARSRI